MPKGHSSAFSHFSNVFCCWHICPSTWTLNFCKMWSLVVHSNIIITIISRPIHEIPTRRHYLCTWSHSSWSKHSLWTSVLIMFWLRWWLVDNWWIFSSVISLFWFPNHSATSQFFIFLVDTIWVSIHFLIGFWNVVVSICFNNPLARISSIFWNWRQVWLWNWISKVRRHTTSVEWLGTFDVRYIIYMSSSYWWFVVLRSVTFNLPNFNIMPSTLCFHFINRIQWINISFSYKFIFLWRIDISGVYFVIWNVGDSVLF